MTNAFLMLIMIGVICLILTLLGLCDLGAAFLCDLYERYQRWRDKRRFKKSDRYLHGGA